MKKLSIYIHIPFCVQKCRYCDFLSAPADESVKENYVEALKREINQESARYSEYEVVTIFFGGGTPSILPSDKIGEVLAVIRNSFFLSDNTEISLEINPGTADYEKLAGLKKAGVNRLSIGLQSTNNEELRMIGRIHTYEDFLKTYMDARKVGFENINIDLMSALPGQNQNTWRTTLERVMELEPEHISAYSLIIEEGTFLYEHLDSFPDIPSDEEDRLMYQDTKRLLAQNGYQRYEISNYAKEGYECKHNSVYWTRDCYVGFGLGASSMVENVRWKNTDELIKYMSSGFDFSKEEIEELTIEDCMSEYMFLGLRMMKGISVEGFERMFNRKITDIYGEIIKKWSEKGYLIFEGDNIRLSDEGIDISNQIFADFI